MYVPGLASPGGGVRASKVMRNFISIAVDDLVGFVTLKSLYPGVIHTPNFDRVAARGVRFTRCYVQSPICGSSRMSAYTGRYCHSHGAQWNGYPLKVGEHTLGDHMRSLGWACHLIGKTPAR